MATAAPCDCADHRDHGPLTAGGRERWYADAERRLGRPLTDGERHIDIPRYDRDLREGKARLHEAIQQEVRRSIRLYMRGRANWRPRVTNEMLDILQDLYLAGDEHAIREMRSMGVPVEFGLRKRVRQSAGFKALVRQLGELVGRIGFRITKEVPKLLATLSAGELTRASALASNPLQAMILAKAEKRVPGSLDAAGRVVSAAIASGLGDAYFDRADRFPCWIYSAVMDNATCGPCRALDGTKYRTIAEIQVVLPNGGPNPACLGDGRCRCRWVPCPPDLSR